MKIISKDTKIIKFNPSDIKTTILLKDMLNIDTKTLSTYRNWVNINNTWYYYKEFNFNEILGEYLAKSINLNTVHNIIGINENDKNIFKTYYTLTKNFRKRGNNYYLIKDILSDAFNYKIEYLEQITKNKENYLKLKNDILLLTSLDIYMRQLDRDNPYNLVFEKDKQRNINLCPIFDYSISWSLYDKYQNPFMDINFNKADLYEQFKLYPELYDMLKFWLDFDINKVLEEIKNDYNFKFNNSFVSKIKKEDAKSKKLIKSII